jgi:hypothetical protein
MVEAKSANAIGYIAGGLIFIGLLIIIAVDLPAIINSLRYLRVNLAMLKAEIRAAVDRQH